MLSQSFGDAVASNEADIINTIEFDSTGRYFATGDKGGRVVVFRSTGERPTSVNSRTDIPPAPPRTAKAWSPYFQYQSHEPEFDYLKSVEIEEKINQLKFCPSIGDKLFILSTNDKTIKLWKLSQGFDYQSRAVEEYSSSQSLVLPSRVQPITYSTLRRRYHSGHAYNINSICVCSDQETFLSCDDLRVNCWQLELSDTCFTLVDIKPPRMEELKEVITACRSHPLHAHCLAYCTSRGMVKLVDRRASALCDSPVASMSELDNPYAGAAGSSNFSEIISSITDINYDSSGRYIVSRDFMAVKVWDTHMASQPVARIPVHEHLQPFLADLLEADSLFDRFEASFSPDGSQVVTGSYSNQFYLLNVSSCSKEGPLQLPFSGSAQPTPNSSFRRGASPALEPDGRQREIRIPRAKVKGVTEIRADQKILHCKWHPHDQMVAIGGQAGLYIYQI